jgi:hypothetical protein
MSDGGASRVPVATRSLSMRWSKPNIRPRLDWCDASARRCCPEAAGFVAGRNCSRNYRWVGRRDVPCIDCLLPQPLLLRSIVDLLRRQCAYASRSMGAVHSSCACSWSRVCGSTREEFCAGGQGPRCAGSDGCDLQRQGRDPPHRGTGEIRCVRDFHREWGLGGTGRTHHSDWRRLWVHLGASTALVPVAAHYFDRGRNRRWHRRHLQYSGWRGLICPRDHHERGQRQDPGSRCHCDGYRRLRRATVLRPAPVIRDSGF